jgi:hypothetical protein
LAWTATVALGVSGDVAVGPVSGNLYVVSPPAASCSGGCTAAFNIIPQPSGSTATPEPCSVPNVSFGQPPAILSSPETAVAVSAAHNGLTTNDLYFFTEAGTGCTGSTPCCTSTGNSVAANTDYNGVTATSMSIFLGGSQGFTSVDYTGTTLSNTRSFRTAVTAVAPPSLPLSPLSPIFGTAATDQKVRRTVPSTACLLTPCWDVDGPFTPASADWGLPYTPVFDTNVIYTADDHGKVYAFSRTSGGVALWTQDFRTWTPPSPWPSNSAATVSAPVLLQGGSVLVVRNDGVVALASSTGIVPLLNTAAPVTGAPVSPAIETRSTGGVAYVSDGAGWVWALQIPSAPLAASAAVWPRPGRDSCNSRNAASSCQ